jgi:hypothetical protein
MPIWRNQWNLLDLLIEYPQPMTVGAASVSLNFLPRQVYTRFSASLCPCAAAKALCLKEVSEIGDQ